MGFNRELDFSLGSEGILGFIVCSIDGPKKLRFQASSVCDFLEFSLLVAPQIF